MPTNKPTRSLPNLVRLILTAVMLGVATLGSWSPAAASDHVEPGFVPLSMDNGVAVFDFIPIGDDFFFAGSQQPTGSVALRGLAFDTGTYGDAAIQIDIPSLEHDPGTPISGPVTITQLGLGSTVPIVIGNADGSIEQDWTLELTLSPQVPQNGTLNVLESHPNGGSFNLELPLVPRMTFSNVDSGETRELDFGLMTQPFTIHLQGSSSWARTCPERLHVAGETSNFCPGTDPTTGNTSPFPLRDILNGALLLTVEHTAGMVVPNRPPVLDPIGPLEGLEGATRTFFFSATDPDGDDLVFSIANQPSYSQFVDNGDGTASFTVTAPFGSALELFDVTVTVTDDGSPALNDQETFVLTILPGSGNTPPVLSPIADLTVREGERSEFLGLFEATDANGDIISLRADNLPTGCDLLPNASVPGTVIANLLCDPDVKPGSFTVTVTATDVDGASDSKTFTLTVLPKVDAGGPYTATQGATVQLQGECPSCVDEDGNQFFNWDLDADGEFDDASGLNPFINTGDFEVGDNPIAAKGCAPGTDVCDEDTTKLILVGEFEADLELVEKKDVPSPALVGTLTRYVVTVRNNGPNAAEKVEFADSIELAPAPGEAQVDGDSIKASSEDCGTITDSLTAERWTVRCEIGTLERGETATIVIEFVPTTTGTIRNGSAVVTGDFPYNDSTPDNNHNRNRPTITNVVNVDVYITAVVGPMVADLQGDAPDQLNGGQARALFATLRAARAAFERGDYKAARQQIEAYRRQVDSVGGHLPQEPRDALTAEADRMLQSMNAQGLGTTGR